MRIELVGTSYRIVAADNKTPAQVVADLKRQRGTSDRFVGRYIAAAELPKYGFDCALKAIMDTKFLLPQTREAHRSLTLRTFNKISVAVTSNDIESAVAIIGAMDVYAVQAGESSPSSIQLFFDGSLMDSVLASMNKLGLVAEQVDP